MKHMLLLLLLVAVPQLTLGQSTSSYRMPDVRNEYCGIHINYQYCKCAFHGNFCSAIDQTQSSARAYVMSEFKTWVGDKIEAMARYCLEAGNQWNASTRTCTETEEPSAPTSNLETRYSLPDMTGLPEPGESGPYGKVTAVDGQVFVYQRSFDRWLLAKPGQPLYNGDFIFTREGTTRVLHLGAYEDFINLGQETVLETSPPKPPEQTSEPNVMGVIQRGAARIYNAVQETSENRPETPEWYRQLHSPTVVASARGTEFLMLVDDNSGDTTVILNEGSVAVTPINATTSTLLTPGTQAVFTNNEMSTTTFTDWQSLLINEELVLERVEATAEELDLANIPASPETDDAADESGLNREELIGDLSELDKQFNSNFLGIWVVVLILVGTGWFGYRKYKQWVAQ